MPEPTSPIGELKQLSERERKRVLAVLGPHERSQVVAMLAASEPPQLSFEAMAEFSPWLLKKVDLARADGPNSGLTPAARDLLLSVFQQIVTSRRPQSDRIAPRATRRSILGILLRERNAL